MSEHDSFEERLRAMADELSRSLQRMSEVDLGEVAERFGVDAERARAFADVAGQWLSDQVTGVEPLFSQEAPPGPQSRRAERGGPHPRDLPTEDQGRALAALDSGRWAVQPGSNRLRAAEGPQPPEAAPDLVSDLRARDWITTDGTLTLVGRHALGRWCRAADDPVRPRPAPPEEPAA